MCPKGSQYQQQHANGECKPSDTIGVFHLRFDRGDERVRDIYFSRQLSHDEAQRKVHLPPASRDSPSTLMLQDCRCTDTAAYAQ